jgi:hypothetical protein
VQDALATYFWHKCASETLTLTGAEPAAYEWLVTQPVDIP